MQFRARYNPELAYDVLQYKEHFRQRITSLYDTLSLPTAATMPLSGLLADDNPITTIAWYAVLTDEVLVGYMLPEPES